MNRRGFLKFLGVGLPAAVVAEKVGLIEQVRTYFFAPKMGWNHGPVGYLDGIPYFVNNSTTGEFIGLKRDLRAADCIALQLEKMREHIPTLVRNDDVLFDMISVRGKMKGQFKAPMLGYNQIDWDKALEI